MTDLRYVHAAPAYFVRGWTGVLPLPYRRKANPPTGWTGRGAPYPDRDQIIAWCVQHPRGGAALRMPDTVLGLDVDMYDGKQGRESLDALLDECGPIPPTWVSTSRADGSGIRLYRVPAGVRWAERRAGPGIELLHAGHRYAVVWPSVHPEGRLYRWYTPTGELADTIPRVADLPTLPAAWGRRLCELVVPQTRTPGTQRRNVVATGSTYAERALSGALAELAALRPGERRNSALNRKAYHLGGLVAAGLLDEQTVRTGLYDAARANGHLDKHGEKQTLDTINSGLTAGMARPLTLVGARR